MTEDLRRLALILFDLHAIEFGEFALVMHDDHPNAPKSPFRLNFRTPDNPKPGPMTAEVLELIGRALVQKVLASDIILDCIAGVPNAGDPIAAAFAKVAAAEFSWPLRCAKLTKVEENGERRVVATASTFAANEHRVLLIDDVVTLSKSKKVAAAAVRQVGVEVGGFAVVVDRGQGGVQALKDEGYEVIYVFTLSELLDLYVAENLIAASMRDEVQNYKRRVDEYFAALEPGI